VLLVAGNVIWLPEQFHTTRHLRLETFVHLPFSFWKFCFSSLFCFTLLLRTTERYIRGYCVPRKCSCFLSTCRAAPFDCGLANCQRCYVGLHRCYVDTLKLVMYVFASSVCFTRNLARFRKKKICPASPKTAVAILKEGDTSIWLTVTFGLLSPMFSLCRLVIGRSRGKRFKFSRPCWLKREHILAIDQLFHRSL